MRYSLLASKEAKLWGRSRELTRSQFRHKLAMHHHTEDTWAEDMLREMEVGKRPPEFECGGYTLRVASSMEFV
jgi:hypothetical protein